MYSPKFTISPKVNNLIAHIDVIRAKVERVSILPQQEIILRYKAVVESIHSSTSIEGNPLNKNQVEQALSGKLNGWERSVIEVINYKKAWDRIVGHAKQRKDLSLENILELHGIVMRDLLPEAKTGNFRPGSVYIADIINGVEMVKYSGPKARKLKVLLEELFDFINENPLQLHPVLLAGIFHYEFVSIHPFSDGNGRVTRLLVKLLLDGLGYDFRGSLVLDRYYWQNQTAYYEALNRANNYVEQRSADLNPWIEYFVVGFYAVVKDLEKQVDLVKHFDINASKIRLNEDEIRILDYLQQFSQIGLREAVEVASGSERTVQRRLKSLVDKGLIRQTGQGKNTVYVGNSTAKQLSK